MEVIIIFLCVFIENENEVIQHMREKRTHIPRQIYVNSPSELSESDADIIKRKPKISQDAIEQKKMDLKDQSAKVSIFVKFLFSTFIYNFYNINDSSRLINSFPEKAE